MFLGDHVAVGVHLFADGAAVVRVAPSQLSIMDG